MSLFAAVRSLVVLAATSAAAVAADPPGIVSTSFGPGWLSAIRAMPGGGAIAAGHTRDHPDGIFPAWIVGVDREGKKLWELKQTAPENRGAQVDALFPRPDGLLSAFGIGRGANLREQGFHLVLRQDGAIADIRMFGEALSGWSRATVPMDSGGFASLADEYLQTGKPNQLLVLYDRDGRELKRTAIEKTVDPSPLLRPSPSGELVVARKVDNAAAGGPGFAASVMFFSPSGDLLRETRIAMDGVQEMAPNVIAVAPTGDVFVAGIVDAPRAPDLPEMWLARIGPDGRLLWARRAGPVGQVFPAVIAVSQNGQVVVGGCHGADQQVTEPWLIRFDGDGNADGELTRHRTGGGVIMGLDIAADDSILATGVHSNGCGFYDGKVEGSDTFIDIIPAAALRPAQR